MTKLDTARDRAISERAISEREEEQVREQLILLQYRNSSSPYKLNRLWKRYMKCIDTKKESGNERKTKNG